MEVEPGKEGMADGGSGILPAQTDLFRCVRNCEMMEKVRAAMQRTSGCREAPRGPEAFPAEEASEHNHMNC